MARRGDWFSWHRWLGRHGPRAAPGIPALGVGGFQPRAEPTRATPRCWGGKRGREERGGGGGGTRCPRQRPAPGLGASPPPGDRRHLRRWAGSPRAPPRGRRHPGGPGGLAAPRLPTRPAGARPRAAGWCSPGTAGMWRAESRPPPTRPLQGRWSADPKDHARARSSLRRVQHHYGDRSAHQVGARNVHTDLPIA